MYKAKVMFVCSLSLVVLIAQYSFAASTRVAGNWNSDIWSSTTLSGPIDPGYRPLITDQVNQQHHLVINSEALMNVFLTRDETYLMSINSGANVIVGNNWNGAANGGTLTVTMNGGSMTISNTFQQAASGTGTFNQLDGSVQCAALPSSAGGLKLTGTYNLHGGTFLARRVYAPALNPGVFNANGGTFYLDRYEAAGTLFNTNGATFAVGGFNGAIGYSRLVGTVVGVDIDYYQSDGSFMEVDIAGYTPGSEYDVFLANQTEETCDVHLDGTLLINLDEDFAASVTNGAVFDVVRADALTIGDNFKLGGEKSGRFEHYVEGNHLKLRVIPSKKIGFYIMTR